MQVFSLDERKSLRRYRYSGTDPIVTSRLASWACDNVKGPSADLFESVFDSETGPPPDKSDYRNVALGPHGVDSHFPRRPFLRTYLDEASHSRWITVERAADSELAP
jgi:hypothetical protein